MKKEYVFQDVEKKAQKYWDKGDCFKVKEEGKILLSFDVALSKRKHSYGACEKLQ